ncbi:hypothetical protein [Microbacterium sp. NPDC058389]|uniref:hypothetical protein n=1 Tax=Microbacterium sp. NPDC058389 TaxID=3346475 RepID=UPI0036487845
MDNETDLTYLNRITRWGDTEWARGFAEILLEFLGLFRTPNLPTKVKKVLARCSYATLPPTALAVVLSEKTPDAAMDDPAVDSFVRDAVSVAAPHTAYAAKLMVRRAAHFVTWCVRDQGWPLDAEVIWSVRAIELYVSTVHSELKEGTRRNYRALLIRISEVLLPEQHPERTASLSGKDTAEPYTREEMAKFRTWAGDQLTPDKRDRAMLMLVLCAGAGVRPREIPFIYHHHVTVDEDGILLVIDAEDGRREVPLLAEWEEWMIVLLERRPRGASLWGPVTRSSFHNLTSAFTERTHGDPPRADRLRHTWLTHHLTVGVPMKDLFRAVGVSKMGHLPQLLEHIDYRSETEYRRIFRSEDNA